MWISQLMSRLTLSLKKKHASNWESGQRKAGRTKDGAGGGGNVPTRRRGSVWNFDFQVEAKKESTSAVKLPCRYLPPPEWSQGVHPPFTRHFSRFLRHLLTRLFLFSSPFFFQRQMAFLLYLWNIISPSFKTLAFLFSPISALVFELLVERSHNDGGVGVDARANCVAHVLIICAHNGQVDTLSFNHMLRRCTAASASANIFPGERRPRIHSAQVEEVSLSLPPSAWTISWNEGPAAIATIWWGRQSYLKEFSCRLCSRQLHTGPVKDKEMDTSTEEKTKSIRIVRALCTLASAVAQKKVLNAGKGGCFRLRKCTPLNASLHRLSVRIWHTVPLNLSFRHFLLP